MATGKKGFFGPVAAQVAQSVEPVSQVGFEVRVNMQKVTNGKTIRPLRCLRSVFTKRNCPAIGSQRCVGMPAQSRAMGEHRLSKCR